MPGVVVPYFQPMIQSGYLSLLNPEKVDINADFMYACIG